MKRTVSVTLCKDDKNDESLLQEDSKAEEDAAKNSSHAEGSIRHEARRSSASFGCARACGLLSAETSDRDLVGGRGLARLRSGGGRGRKGGIAQIRGLRTTGMIGSALAPAGVVAIAGSHTVVTPSLANEEGQCLRVLRDVGDNAVFAHTRVGQVIRVAGVGSGGHGGHTRLLETDEGTLGFVLLAPVLSIGVGDTFGIDGVGVILLGSTLGGREANQGGSTESEDRGVHGG